MIIRSVRDNFIPKIIYDNFDGKCKQSYAFLKLYYTI